MGSSKPKENQWLGTLNVYQMKGSFREYLDYLVLKHELNPLVHVIRGNPRRAKNESKKAQKPSSKKRKAP